MLANNRVAFDITVVRTGYKLPLLHAPNLRRLEVEGYRESASRKRMRAWGYLCATAISPPVKVMNQNMVMTLDPLAERPGTFSVQYHHPTFVTLCNLLLECLRSVGMIRMVETGVAEVDTLDDVINVMACNGSDG